MYILESMAPDLSWSGQDWNWRMPSSSVSKNTKYFFAQEDSAFWMFMDILLSRRLPEGGCT